MSSNVGQAKRRRDAFLNEHPFCAFCGGAAPTTSEEHCPPRALFQFRQWPKGMVFPACDVCNQESRKEDTLVAMLARINPFSKKGDQDGNTANLMASVHGFYPGLFEKMLPDPAMEARFQNEIRAIDPDSPADKLPGVVQVPEEMRVAVGQFAKKFGKAMYYRELKKAFPLDGGLACHFATNADLIQHGHYPVLELLKTLGGEVPKLERNGNDLRDQMVCKLSFTDDRILFVVQAVFGTGFSLVVIGSPERGKIEDLIRRMSERTGKPSPFQLLTGIDK